MPPDVTNLAKRIDDDRREREAALLLLLIGLNGNGGVFGQVRQHVYSAIRLNVDPYRAAADVLQGAPHAGPGLAPRLAAQLALAERAGYRRTLLVLPGDGPQPPRDGTYGAMAQARTITGQLLQTLWQRLATAFGAAPGNPRAAVFSAFRDGGYDPRGEHGAWMLETAAENAVQAAYQHGYLAGLARP